MLFLYEFGVVVLLIAIVYFCARPFVEAYTEKMKTQYKAVDSEQASKLEKRINALEGEVLDLRQQLKTVQESADFALKIIQENEKNADAESETIDLKLKTKN